MQHASAELLHRPFAIICQGDGRPNSTAQERLLTSDGWKILPQEPLPTASANAAVLTTLQRDIRLVSIQLFMYNMWCVYHAQIYCNVMLLIWEHHILWERSLGIFNNPSWYGYLSWLNAFVFNQPIEQKTAWAITLHDRSSWDKHTVNTRKNMFVCGLLRWLLRRAAAQTEFIPF